MAPPRPPGHRSSPATGRQRCSSRRRKPAREVRWKASGRSMPGISFWTGGPPLPTQAPPGVRRIHFGGGVNLGSNSRQKKAQKWFPLGHHVQGGGPASPPIYSPPPPRNPSSINPWSIPPHGGEHENSGIATDFRAQGNFWRKRWRENFDLPLVFLALLPLPRD